jgi:biopolymer transport protein ExbD
MKLESNLPRQSPWLYIAPLLTAILLLLIYFLLSSGFITQSGISLHLPESPARLAGFESAHIVTLAPGSPVRIFFNGDPISRQELAAKLSSEQQLNRRALVHADRLVPFGHVMEISQIILNENYDVAYATTPTPEGINP